MGDRPGGEFGEKCPHCGHYNRFSVRKDWRRGKKRICNKCGNDTTKAPPLETMKQATLTENDFKIIDLPPDPEEKTLQIRVSWHDWNVIDALMNEYGWDLAEVFYHIFGQWTRLERWLEHDEDLKQIWESICEEENDRLREAMDAMQETVDPEIFDMEFEEPNDYDPYYEGF